MRDETERAIMDNRTAMPDISGCSTTREKIAAFLVCIESEELLDKIYRFVKYIYFYKA